MLNVTQIVTGPLEENVYLIDNGRSLLVVDPGSEAEKIETEIEKTGSKPVAILLTHCHYDHIGAVTAIRNKYGIPVYVSSNEQEWLGNPAHNGSQGMQAYGISEISVEPAEFEFELKEYEFDGMKFRVVETPGHSFGSVSFIFDDFAVVGDALFKGSIGRTDLYTGDSATLLASIERELFTLPDETVVYPGHREETTIGHEKATNPFFN
ncbi:MBL fold metallo-hydrolase [Listeria ilorinensis]|uniref:MBL fold metallo-hydrolase n=1 Tax=Listeria ilorinensis TaxID=2867439 RepID=UPI001EF5AC62|nr:MBL fold metallo-hydrolase [Listeria ilorinensis]